jgi:hypothetical protein
MTPKSSVELFSTERESSYWREHHIFKLSARGTVFSPSDPKVRAPNAQPYICQEAIP